MQRISFITVVAFLIAGWFMIYPPVVGIPQARPQNQDKAAEEQAPIVSSETMQLQIEFEKRLDSVKASNVRSKDNLKDAKVKSAELNKILKHKTRRKKEVIRPVAKTVDIEQPDTVVTIVCDSACVSEINVPKRNWLQRVKSIFNLKKQTK